MLCARGGVIIEWPLNGQFHNRRDVILTSQMAVSSFIVKSRYYDDQKSRNLVYKITVAKRQVVSKILLMAWSRLRRDW